MKKTLITLAALAMASVASAEWTMTPAIQTTGPVTGGEMAFTFMLTSDDVTELTSQTTIAAYGQSLSSATGNAQGSVAFTLAKTETNGSYTFSIYNDTLNSSSYAPSGWGGASHSSATVTLATDTIYTVSGSTDASSGQITISLASPTTTLATISNNGKMNGGGAVGDVMWTYFNSSFSTADSAPVTPAVPEPTTATLSLLALAGLAARRRRK